MPGRPPLRLRETAFGIGYQMLGRNAELGVPWAPSSPRLLRPSTGAIFRAGSPCLGICISALWVPGTHCNEVEEFILQVQTFTNLCLWELKLVPDAHVIIMTCVRNVGSSCFITIFFFLGE